MPSPDRTKRLVQQALNKAVRDGLLNRPSRCSSCGKPGDIEAHHEDYSKPYDVEWLCGDCHRSKHASPQTFWHVPL
jgi:ribosomal protein S27AE